jgi:hypothetical protein
MNIMARMADGSTTCRRKEHKRPTPDSAQQRNFAIYGLHGAVAVAGVAAFERGNWTQSYAKHVCPRLSPKAKMKILFLLHALLKEIQELSNPTLRNVP